MHLNTKKAEQYCYIVFGGSIFSGTMDDASVSIMSSCLLFKLRVFAYHAKDV